MTLTEIEKLTERYSAHRDTLFEAMLALQEEIDDVKKKHLPHIKKMVERTGELQAQLKAAIEASPDLFEKPKTLVIFGIRIGFGKQKGRLEWKDDGVVVKLCKRLFPETWQTYIQVKEKPMKKALSTLPVADLKKLGIEEVGSGDGVIIKPIDSEVEKLVDRLLKEKEEEITDQDEAA